MKRRRLELRAETVRVLAADELRLAGGGFFVTTALKTVCKTCSESCTTGLDTTVVRPMG